MDVDTLDVLEHLNEDHAEEVLSIAQVTVPPPYRAGNNNASLSAGRWPMSPSFCWLMNQREILILQRLTVCLKR